MRRRPETSAPKVPESNSPPSRERPKIIAAVDYDSARDAIDDRLENDTDFANMNSEEVVGFFAYCYEALYKSAPDTLRTNAKQWQNAVGLARSLMGQLGGDSEIVAKYINWAFGRELSHRKQAHKHGRKYDRIIGFPLVLGGSMIDEFRVAYVAENHEPLPEPIATPSIKKTKPGNRPTPTKGVSKERPWFFQVMQSLQASDLTSIECYVVLTVAQACDGSHVTWISQATIAERAHCGERTVRATLSKLENDPNSPINIKRTKRGDAGGRTSDLIHLDLPAPHAGKGGL